MPETQKDDLESARILIQENLLDEAKKVLFRIISRGGDHRAEALLKQIENLELKQFHAQPIKKIKSQIEDSETLISLLERDLQIHEPKISEEKFQASSPTLNARELFDLGVAYFEMGCYSDALRELKKAEKKIRIESTFLGNLGVSIVALIAESMVRLERAFEAKVFLDPILVEPDLPHEQKIILYYTMGLAEQALDDPQSALGWYRKVVATDPGFRDVELRVRVLTQR